MSAPLDVVGGVRMPILRVNAGHEGLAINGSPACARSVISGAAIGTGPVIILIHGFKYDPENAARSPHTGIFGTPKHPVRARKAQWLRPLGFGTGNADEGLAIAFAWRARANLWQAECAAHVAGRRLAEVIALIHRRSPARPIHVISHSMGSEVVFEALKCLPAGAIARIIALSAASYSSRVVTAMQTSAGQKAQLFNITSRENDVFDFIYEWLVAPPKTGDRAMGLGVDLPNAVNIQIDCARTLAVLAHFGGHIAPPSGGMCHWSSYTRPGVLPFYGRILRCPETVSLTGMQKMLPKHVARRWSRIVLQPRMAKGLPAVQSPAAFAFRHRP
ncbi:alpha/beta hydrolase [Tateyamaria sp.]|uniref:alpha/beta hydrolase n=1 Tax=Tateyamaria sp. TaxID=1929288 RepID=UPI0032A05430